MIFIDSLYLKGGKTLYIYTKNHVDYIYIYINKRKNNILKIIIVQMYEIMKIQMHFQSNYLIFLL
jgi:hypothetical protein